MPSNNYFDNSTEDALPKGATARAESVDAKFNSITSGLDKLPTQAENNAGTRNYAGTSSGSAGAYAATLAHVTALIDGQELEFIANHANPASGATIDLSGIGATSAILADGSALPANSIVKDGTYRFKYNATLAKWTLDTSALATSTATTTSLIDAGGLYTDPGSGKQVEAALQETGNNIVTNTADIATNASDIADKGDRDGETFTNMVIGIGYGGGALVQSSVIDVSVANPEFGSIPSWAKKIVLVLSVIKLDGGIALGVRLGDSDGIDITTSYVNFYQRANTTGTVAVGGDSETSFNIGNTLDANGKCEGIITLTHVKDDKWIYESIVSQIVPASGTEVWSGTGTKVLDKTLDRIHLIKGSGSWVSGQARITYEG